MIACKVDPKLAGMPRLMLIIGLSCVACASTARAQTGPDYLYWRFSSSVNPISTSLSDLGLDGTITQIYDTFITELDRRQWPLIIIRRIDAISERDQRALIDRLEAQLDGGARLLVHLAELEDMPRMQAFLGLEGAEDFVELQDVRALDLPRHPAGIIAEIRASDQPVGDEYGAVLLPGASTKTIYTYDDGSIASVLAHDGRTIVNSWEPNAMGGGTRFVYPEQLGWLISCPADLDGDGRRTLFDFLEFQTLFDAGDPRADWFCYDGRLDVFDFLAFFNQFEAGCP